MEDSRRLHEKAQLDKSEREEIEKVVYQMRERVESYYRHVLEEQYGLDSKPEGEVSDKKKELVTAIERELTEDKSWDEALDQYIKGLGYTLVNRLAAFRCMEVRDFIDREVTQFRESRTPAADPLVEEEFMDDNEATIEAYKRECDRLAEEIEILFDLSDPYSVLDPEMDLFRDLCELLDEIDDDLWLADDVLGWVYEYYNAPDLEDVREKARTDGLDPEDTTVANQFYTPHWVVRMLTDNSLGKLFLEYKGSLQDTIKKQQDMFSVEDRKNRSTHPEEAPSITELCTYLVPTEEEGEPTDFDHPSEIRVLDPACGSGHFLLYAFDILERIWWEETDVDRKEVPRKILENNLFGVDLDLRACQLAAFNLYLKGRSRAEDEGIDEFTMPQLGIVCSDSHIADIEEAEEVFEEVAGDHSNLKASLEEILEDFEKLEGLGSLLDVKGILSEEFIQSKDQAVLSQFNGNDFGTLGNFLDSFHEEIEKRISNGMFLAQDLQSFLKLVKILSQSYDVTLMNPPYGHRGRMPNGVKKYIELRYNQYPEYYINFYEQCVKTTKTRGRIGFLIPSSFMFKDSFKEFRESLIEDVNIEFLTENGVGILDKATVNTVSSVIRSDSLYKSKSKFIRLHDVDVEEKEETFIETTLRNIERKYSVPKEAFRKTPGYSFSYWVPEEIRELFESDIVLENRNEKQAKSHGRAAEGIATGLDPRFTRYFWECKEITPFVKGGSKAWLIPQIKESLLWGRNGKEIRRYEGGNGTPNEDLYFKEMISFNNIKTKDGRRFGYLPQNSIFSHVSYVYKPKNAIWETLGYLNSYLVTYLMLSQTTDRHWQIEEIINLPWDEDLENKDMQELTKNQYDLLREIRSYDFCSPYFEKPILLETNHNIDPPEIYLNHPHWENNTISKGKFDTSKSIKKLWESKQNKIEELEKRLENHYKKTNSLIYDLFDISVKKQKVINNELKLRLGEDPENPQLLDFSYNLPTQIKKTILYFTIKILEKEGILVLNRESDNEKKDLMNHIVNIFERVWDDYAEDRLAEADQILGDRPSVDEAYPNIQHFLENELFEFHLHEFENTPILWKLTTDRLVSDPEGTGFSCLIDYHQLDENLFDTLKARYLEPRKSALREKRSTADRRRSDSGLDASEQAEATDEYNRCQSALRQIEELEQKMKELSQIHERDWSEENQRKGEKLVPKVREFRERIKSRLEQLDELRNISEEDWLIDTFSEHFFETIDEEREEWIDALKDLEKVCRAYSKGLSSPVEAHLYDLFHYFYDDLIGSKWWTSTGILLMYKYFEEKGEKYVENGEPRAGIEKKLEILGDLAISTEKDLELCEEIEEGCKELEKEIPSDWKDRAISEVMTGGYSPVHKHGVAINIEPLAKKNIVPKIVEDKVIL